MYLSAPLVNPFYPHWASAYNQVLISSLHRQTDGQIHTQTPRANCNISITLTLLQLWKQRDLFLETNKRSTDLSYANLSVATLSVTPLYTKAFIIVDVQELALMFVCFFYFSCCQARGATTKVVKSAGTWSVINCQWTPSSKCGDRCSGRDFSHLDSERQGGSQAACVSDLQQGIS